MPYIATAQYVRVWPVSFCVHPCLRIEIYGEPITAGGWYRKNLLIQGNVLRIVRIMPCVHPKLIVEESLSTLVTLHTTLGTINYRQHCKQWYG